MTVDDLLKPRYKQINDRPFMNDNYKVGKIYVFETDVETGIISAYPHLFKKLEWWQERKESEMPEYLKHQSGWVSKVVKHFSSSWDEYTPYGCKISESFYSYSNLTPSTKTEYDSYINTKP